MTKAYATSDYYSATIQAILIAAETAAEIAVISSQKYAKGTKSAKGGMALVGEQGPEFMYVPQQAKILTAKQTKDNSKVIDAIYDNRLEQLVLKDYVLPALEKQKEEFRKFERRQFSDNIVKSLYFNGLTANEAERLRKRGTVINNGKEIAESLAEILSSKYDRRRVI